tara:strand:+ start:131 stop:322 length:192 start_codon:yes stop_codon:yes gene_type:complete
MNEWRQRWAAMQHLEVAAKVRNAPQAAGSQLTSIFAMWRAKLSAQMAQSYALSKSSKPLISGK